jgi:hypothetical protein
MLGGGKSQKRLVSFRLAPNFRSNSGRAGTDGRYGVAVGVGRTAMISAVGVWHWEVSPVCRIWGVE